MPINKNAEHRYRVLDQCFRDQNRRYTIDDLLRKVNEVYAELYGTSVSIRQLYEDIKTLRELTGHDAPIVAFRRSGGQKAYYRYSDPEFSIYKSDLSEGELEKLRATIDMLSLYRALPGYAWLEENLSSLELRLGLKASGEKLVSFDQNEGLQGVEYLSTLIDATLHHESLELVYQPFGKEPMTIEFSPYYLKQYNGRWFLFGRGYGSEILNLALDRIKSLKQGSGPFHTNEGFDFTSYFREIVGVSVPRSSEEVPIQTIVIRFSAGRLPYVLSKPLHHSQRLLDSEDCTLSIVVRPTRELDQQLLSFGPDAEVLSPESYRKRIGEKIAKMHRIYSESD